MQQQLGKLSGLKYMEIFGSLTIPMKITMKHVGMYPNNNL